MTTARACAEVARQVRTSLAFPLTAFAVLAIGGLLLSSYVTDVTKADPEPAAPRVSVPAGSVSAAPVFAPAEGRSAAMSGEVAAAHAALGAKAAAQRVHAPAAPAALPVASGKAGAQAQSAARHTHFRVGERNVKRILLDGERVWVGTSGGLIRYSPATDEYKLYDTRSGLKASSVIFVGRIGGAIFVGTMGGGLSVLDPQTERWEHYGAAEGLADGFVHDVLKASSGDIWIATRSGLNRVRGGALRERARWQHFTVANTDKGLPSDRIYALAEGRGGEIWYATEAGVGRHHDGKWRHWRDDEGESAAATRSRETGAHDSDPGGGSRFAVAVVVDAAGDVWAGTLGGGLLRFDGTRWSRYTLAEGLPGNNVFTLHRDAKDLLWVGTDNGLARMQDGKFRVMTTQDGLLSNAVFAVASRPDTLWAGGFGGVARITATP